MSTGYSTITGTKFQDASGNPLASGRMTCWPVNNQSQPVSATVAGGGMIAVKPVSFVIVNGAITTDTFGRTPQLADTALTSPTNIGYKVRVVDASTNTEVQGPGYDCVQPTGATWSFDTFVPSQPALVAVVSGPPGPQGPATVVTSNGANGNFGVAGALSAKQIAGAYQVSQFNSSPSATDGLANVVAVAPAGAHIELDPANTLGSLVETDPNGVGMIGNGYAAGTILHDRRGAGTAAGQNNILGIDVDGSKLGVRAVILSHRTNPNPTYYRNSTADFVGGFWNAPGTMAKGAESSGLLSNRVMRVGQKGVHQGTLGYYSKFGVGDFGLDYAYMDTYAGSINPDDEFVNAGTRYIVEGNVNSGAAVPQALITSTGTAPDGTPFLRLNPTQTPGEFGSGRYALLLTTSDGSTDAAIATYTASAQAVVGPTNYASVTTNETISSGLIAAVWGQCAAFTVPFALDLPQAVSLTVTLQGGAAAAPGSGPGGTGVLGYVAGIASLVSKYRNERIQVVTAHTPVLSGEIYTQVLDCLVRQNGDGADGSGALPGFLIQDAGGTASGLGQCLAKNAFIGVNSLNHGQNSLCYPVLGATGANTLLIAANATRGGGLMFLKEPIVFTATLTRNSAGLVTVSAWSSPTGSLYDMGMTPLQIVATDTSFNAGAQVLLQQENGTDFSYQTGNTTAASTTGTLTAFGGMNTLKIYRGCEVVRTAGTVASYPDRIGNYIGLEPNNITWSVGAKIESPSHHSFSVTGNGLGINSVIPVGDGQGEIREYGNAVTRAGSSFAAQTFTNQNNQSDYLQNGGPYQPPTFQKIFGTWGTIFDWRYLTGTFQVFFSLPGFDSTPGAYYDQVRVWMQMQGNTAYFDDRFSLQNDTRTTTFGPYQQVIDARQGVATTSAELHQLNGSVAVGSLSRNFNGQVNSGDNTVHNVTGFRPPVGSILSGTGIAPGTVVTASYFNQLLIAPAATANYTGGLTATSSGAVSTAAGISHSAVSAIASAASVQLAGAVVHLTGTASISNFTPPIAWPSGNAGNVSVIADAAWQTVTGGNIGNAITAVAGTLYHLTYDGTTWYVK